VRSGEVKFELVDVAPSPVFTGFKRSHDGVIGGVKVLGGVLIFRGVTAADVSAGKTHAQMNPAITTFKTLFTSLRGSRRHVPDLVKMSAFFHRFPRLAASSYYCVSSDEGS
jgi:hypothetical protein